MREIALTFIRPKIHTNKLGCTIHKYIKFSKFHTITHQHSATRGFYARPVIFPFRPGDILCPPGDISLLRRDRRGNNNNDLTNRVIMSFYF